MVRSQSPGFSRAFTRGKTANALSGQVVLTAFVNPGGQRLSVGSVRQGRQPQRTTPIADRSRTARRNKNRLMFDSAKVGSPRKRDLSRTGRHSHFAGQPANDVSHPDLIIPRPLLRFNNRQIISTRLKLLPTSTSSMCSTFRRPRDMAPFDYARSCASSHSREPTSPQRL